eukprot:COSAG06_NODE_2983_length_5987_cov_5.375679_2_plen_61_part_00
MRNTHTHTRARVDKSEALCYRVALSVADRSLTDGASVGYRVVRMIFCYGTDTVYIHHDIA